MGLPIILFVCIFSSRHCALSLERGNLKIVLRGLLSLVGGWWSALLALGRMDGPSPKDTRGC